MDVQHASEHEPHEDAAIASTPDTEQAASTSVPASGASQDHLEKSVPDLSQTGTEAATQPPLPEDESALLTANPNELAPDTLQPATLVSRWRWTRRQYLIAVGVAAGALAMGGGTTLALLASPSTSGTAQVIPSTATPMQTALPTQGTPLPLVQALQAWRMKHLTAARTQRFQHRQGNALVPLGVVEPTFPNPYNPYHGHVQGYLLGGTVVATNQLFFYLGLESLDGSQFVGKFRVGPIDQPADHFGLLVTQQSTDDIEGGAAEDPLVTLPPNAFYHRHSRPSLDIVSCWIAFASHCLPKLMICPRTCSWRLISRPRSAISFSRWTTRRFITRP